MKAPRSGPLVLERFGLRYVTHAEVYKPHDDTWLLVDAVRDLPDLAPGDVVVEVGCGAGLGLIAALRRGARGMGLDRNPVAVRLARENAARNGVGDRAAFVVGDLVTSMALDRVDWVLFNPPYLPTAAGEHLMGDLDLAFDGGPTGNETLFRFVAGLAEQVRGVARRPGLLLVTSSLNDRRGVKERLRAAGWSHVESMGSAAFPFERLHVEAFRGAAVGTAASVQADSLSS